MIGSPQPPLRRTLLIPTVDSDGFAKEPLNIEPSEIVSISPSLIDGFTNCPREGSRIKLKDGSVHRVNRSPDELRKLLAS